MRTKTDEAYAHVLLNDEQKEAICEITEDFRVLANKIDASKADPRSKAVALTQLQGAKMWAVEAIAKG